MEITSYYTHIAKFSFSGNYELEWAKLLNSSPVTVSKPLRLHQLNAGWCYFKDIFDNGFYFLILWLSIMLCQVIFCLQFENWTQNNNEDLAPVGHSISRDIFKLPVQALNTNSMSKTKPTYLSFKKAVTQNGEFVQDILDS